MKPINLKIKTKQRNYKIIIGSNIIKKISSLLNENLINFEKCLLVVDKNISTKKISEIKKSLKRKKVFTYYFKANEKNKNQINVSKIVESIHKTYPTPMLTPISIARSKFE